MKQNLDYGYEIQKVYLELMLADPDVFVRCSSIFDADLFDRKLKTAAKFISDYSMAHNILPTKEIINAATKLDFDVPENVDSRHYDWLFQEFETFTKHKSLERAILESSELLLTGDYGLVEEKIKHAVQIALTKDLGIDLYMDPKSQLEKMKNNKGLIPTGFRDLDYKLFGGHNIGDLVIYAAPSGGGKSIMLSNLGINWTLMGKNVMYVTLELSEDLVARRLYSMICDTSTREIFKHIDDIELKLKLIAKRAGGFQIKYMPAGKNTNDIRSYIREYQIKHNKKLDILLVDYLDLLYPINKRVPVDNLNLKDKFVSEELRNLGNEEQVLVASASQFNRSSIDEVEYGHNHIAGGLSKIQTSDFTGGIYFPKQLRDRGRIEIQLLKTRNSSGVGSKVNLAINVDTLRMSDCDDEIAEPLSTAQTILQDIKNRNNISPKEQDPAPKVNATVESSKLRALLNQHSNYL